MSTEPTMATWVVTYTNYSESVTGDKTAATGIKVDAAYFATVGHLIEFKDTDHQVVFAIHAGIVSTISRDGAAARWEAGA